VSEIVRQEEKGAARGTKRENTGKKADGQRRNLHGQKAASIKTSALARTKTTKSQSGRGQKAENACILSKTLREENDAKDRSQLKKRLGLARDYGRGQNNIHPKHMKRKTKKRERVEGGRGG